MLGFVMEGEITATWIATIWVSMDMARFCARFSLCWFLRLRRHIRGAKTFTRACGGYVNKQQIQDSALGTN